MISNILSEHATLSICIIFKFGHFLCNYYKNYISILCFVYKNNSSNLFKLIMFIFFKNNYFFK